MSEHGPSWLSEPRPTQESQPIVSSDEEDLNTAEIGGYTN